MIKFGIGGKPLDKSDNREVVLTERGLIKRPVSKDKDNTNALEAARGAANRKNARADMDILSHYAGGTVETQDEANWRKINENGGNV